MVLVIGLFTVRADKKCIQVVAMAIPSWQGSHELWSERAVCTLYKLLSSAPCGGLKSKYILQEPEVLETLDTKAKAKHNQGSQFNVA